MTGKPALERVFDRLSMNWRKSPLDRKSGNGAGPPAAGMAGARPGRQGDGSYKGWSSAPLQMDLLERDGADLDG
jgi:hypothetical protein